MRTISLLAVFSLCCSSACSEGVQPTAPQRLPVVRSIGVAPAGMGIENGTEFTLTADVENAQGATFDWEFGDGTAARGAVVTHVYSRSGSFVVRLTVVAEGGRAERSREVRVASLLGTWIGSVTGHTRFPPNRPIPITGFQLVLHQSPQRSLPGGGNRLLATWFDNAGCRESQPTGGGVHGWVASPRSVRVGVEQLLCNDGDFYVGGTADEEVRVIEGECGSGGPNCRFRMVRQ